MKRVRLIFRRAARATGVALMAASVPVGWGATKAEGVEDGRISRAEFSGSDEAFAKLDRNHDGFLDQNERRGPGGTAAKAPKAPRAKLAMPDNITNEADIVYKTVKGEQLTLDLYGIKGRKYEGAPLAIWIHGGGYVKGTKDGAVAGNPEVFVPLLEEHGYRVASLNYRLCVIGGPKILDCYTDCKDAVRFLMKHATEYGIDAQRVVSVGASAGGGLSLMLAYSGDRDFPGDPELAGVPTHVRAAVSWFGVTDFLKAPEEFASGNEKGLVLFGEKPSEALVQSLSPVWAMNHQAAKIPTLLVHGENDPVVPFGQSAWMKAEADRLGRPVEFIPVKNMRHAFQPTEQGEITPALSEIWKRTLAFIVKSNP